MSATLPFLEKMLQLLGQGDFSSTYKYAVLLGLIDLCVEAGHPPGSVTTAQLARRVVELYWNQVRTFDARGMLRQNTGGHAKITQLISAFRAENRDLHSPPTSGALLDEVEWVLVEYPLPRLQRVGRQEERFLYEIGWGESITRRQWRARGPGGFDNAIRFVLGASEALVALSPVLRPLVQQQWLGMVRQINRLEEANLDDFLFGAVRKDLSRLHAPLRRLQGGRCFYCGDPIRGSAQVDHFLPWSRYPDDGLDNLVLADEPCNRNKLHFLADLGFARRWAERSEDPRLDELAADKGWRRDRPRTLGVVAGTYAGLAEGLRLWQGHDRLRRVEAGDLPALHAFGGELRAAAQRP